MKISGYYLEKTGTSHLWFRVKDSVIRIGHSILGDWSEPCKGKQCLKLVDTGNDYIVTLYNPVNNTKRVIQLDVCEAAYMLHALEELRLNFPNTFNKTLRVTK